MEQLNKGWKYSRNMTQVLINDDGSHWLLAFGCGQSDKNEDYKVTINTDHLKCDEIPDELSDAESTARLISKLLNHYFKGELFTGDPNQLNIWEEQ